MLVGDACSASAFLPPQPQPQPSLRSVFAAGALDADSARVLSPPATARLPPLDIAIRRSKDALRALFAWLATFGAGV